MNSYGKILVDFCFYKRHKNKEKVNQRYGSWEGRERKFNDRKYMVVHNFKAIKTKVEAITDTLTNIIIKI